MLSVQPSTLIKAEGILRQQLKHLENRTHRDDSRLTMKSQLIAIVAAVLVVGCATTQQPEPPTAKAPDISIHDAAVDRNIEAAKQHLAAGTDVNAKDEEGWTPLHIAAIRGNKEIAELLIAKGADVNAKAENDNTPLHQAAFWGHSEIAELLISKGADINAKYKQKFYFFNKNQAKLYINASTPLDNANMNRRTKIIELLRKHGGKKGEVFKAEGK